MTPVTLTDNADSRILRRRHSFVAADAARRDAGRRICTQPKVNVIKLFSLVTHGGENKLERLFVPGKFLTLV